MCSMSHIFEMDFGGRRLVLETGRSAEQANGAVLVRYGDTAVLVTATMQDPREGIDFFPLLVDYEERMYAIGRIPGGWFKREGRPGEGAILVGPHDRPTLRPLFPKVSATTFRSWRRSCRSTTTIRPTSPRWSAPPRR